MCEYCYRVIIIENSRTFTTNLVMLVSTAENKMKFISRGCKKCVRLSNISLLYQFNQDFDYKYFHNIQISVFQFSF